MEKRNKKILGYNKFLEEVSIEGNPGIPGEGDKRPGERNYLRDITKRATDRLGVIKDDGMQTGPLVGRLMSLMRRSINYVRGKEDEISKLAEKVIRHYYKDVVDGVELDIRLGSERDIVDNLKNDSYEDDSDDNKSNKKKSKKGGFGAGDNDSKDGISIKNLKDPNIINKIHKAKIANIITQGEAKNTKHIMHMDIVKDGLKEIFGNRAEEIFDIWIEMTNIADKLDWIIPLANKANMMEITKNSGVGFAGSVSVDWKSDKVSVGLELKSDDEIESQDDADYDDYDDSDDFNLSREEEEVYTPVIIARGIDFPMLLHETVKGIYELLSAVMQPDEHGASEDDHMVWFNVMFNISSFSDEVEDFRTGPEIAADLRDFIFSIEGSDYHPNMREYVYAKMIDPAYFSDKDFLEFFRAILNGEERAKRKMKELIDEVITFLKDYDYKEATGGWDEDDNYDNDNDHDNDHDNDSDDDIAEMDLDYSEMNINQLEKAMMDAVDREDYEEAAIIKNIIDAR